MRAIFKNAIVTFKKKLPAGTEVPVVIDYTTGTYKKAAGQGWYITPDGTFRSLEAYYNKTAISNVIDLEGFSKIRVENILCSSYITHFGFCNSETANKVEKGFRYTPDFDGVSINNQSILESYEMDIPAGYQYVRFNMNINGGGTVPYGPMRATLIV